MAVRPPACRRSPLACSFLLMAVPDPVRRKLSALPHRPGIYLMKDRFGTVIYVGKARDLRKRVSQYFHPSRRMGWDLKFRALVDTIHDFDVHVVKSEPEALLLEGKLIKEFHPKYNVSFRDDKRFLMLKVNLNDPIPRFTFTRLRTDDGARYYGPFADSVALRRTLALARREFNLRGCRPLTPVEADYKHCLYAHLKHCTAPCIGNVTRPQYLEQVRAACDFLEGQCVGMLEHLEIEMKLAAAGQDYERAARLRDLLTALKRTTRKEETFERVPYSLPLAIDPDRDLLALSEALGLPRPPQRIEGFDISNISGTLKVASVVSFREGRPDRANYRRMQIQTVAGQDDFACMAEAVRRRYTRLLKESNSRQPGGQKETAPSRAEGGEPVPQELQRLVNETSAAVRSGRRIPASLPYRSAALPDLILIDGGKGQLNAAREELTKLGLASLPVVGLAKEFEEIHRSGTNKPLRLGLDHPALKLLQRIRDESHRVANAYNAQLRLRKISESILDEFPGIGEARKAALLKKFGSLQRLRAATIEQVAEVPGFGGKGAAELKKFLEARFVST
jgi:excinuclease ABC subunit C